MLEFSAKKPRKFYAVSPDKWFLGTKLTKDEYEKSEEKFLELCGAGGDFVKMKKCLEEGRVFVQIMFRLEDPSTHVQKLKPFWSMPQGPALLSCQFEWLVNGSRDNDLAHSIEDHIDMVLQMTARIMGDKMGTFWLQKLEEARNNSQAKNGNDIMEQVFIIRELAKSWKNEAEKLIFIEGVDEFQQASSQPFIHILKVDQKGESDYEEALVISVRVGSTTVFDDVSLSQGLAAVIQLCFVFNIVYPSSADEIFNFVQRLLAKFGPSDGARNLKGQLKKRFVDFQCELSNIIMLEKSDTVKKLLTKK